MEERVHWNSSGLKISGVVEFPEGLKRGERRAAILVLHGFGSNKDSPMVRTVTRIFTALGYVALRFDMRGCGESEGERGRVICLEQVADTKSAFDFLASTEYADPKRIAVFGTASAPRSRSTPPAPTRASRRAFPRAAGGTARRNFASSTPRPKRGSASAR